MRDQRDQRAARRPDRPQGLDPSKVRSLEMALRLNSVLAALLGGLEALLVTRFGVLAFDVDRSGWFARVVLDVSWFFVRPFEGAIGDGSWDNGVLEWSTLVAIGSWLVVFIVVMALVVALVPRWREGELARFQRRRVTHG